MLARSLFLAYWKALNNRVVCVHGGCGGSLAFPMPNTDCIVSPWLYIYISISIILNVYAICIDGVTFFPPSIGISFQKWKGSFGGM